MSSIESFIVLVRQGRVLLDGLDVLKELKEAIFVRMEAKIHEVGMNGRLQSHAGILEVNHSPDNLRKVLQPSSLSPDSSDYKPVPIDDFLKNIEPADDDEIGWKEKWKELRGWYADGTL